MSDPELNAEDQHLAKALDELARMIENPVQKFVPLTSSRSVPDKGDGDDQIPQPLLEPIPIEVPLPPTPVVVQPTLNSSLAASSEASGVLQDGLLAELSALSSANTVFEPAAPTSTHSAFNRREPSPRSSTVMVALFAVGLFVAGMLTERFCRLLERSQPPERPAKNDAKMAVVDNELTGRVTYKTQQGENQPDRGARILIFPEKRLGEVKLPMTGFRPSDNAADQLIADAIMKAIGGGAATANEAGRFRVPVEAGSYHILILSHFHPRDDTTSDPALQKLLSGYFDKSDELLGRVSYQFSAIRIKGRDDLWDHSF